MNETEITQELKEKLEFYLSDYSFMVKVERDKERDYEDTMLSEKESFEFKGIFFKVSVQYLSSDSKPYDFLCKYVFDHFELNIYEDNFEMLNEAALWRYLYITESNRKR